MLGANPQRTWQSAYLGPQTGTEVVFVPLDPDQGQPDQTQPVVVDSTGRVFAMATYGPLVTSLQVYTPGDETFQPWSDDGVGEYTDPILGADNHVFVGLSGMGTPGEPDDAGIALLSAFNPDGGPLWRYSGGDYSPNHFWRVQTVVDGEGRLVSTVSDGELVELHALTGSGELRWTIQIPGTIVTAPAEAEDGTVYALTDGYGVSVTLTAVSPDGQLRWETPVGVVGDFGTAILAAPAEGPVVRLEEAVIALDADGNERFTKRLNGDPLILPMPAASLAVGEDDAVYFSAFSIDSYGLLFALEPDGSQRWLAETEQYIVGGPTLGADGVVYVTTCARVYAFRPDGTVLFDRPMPETPDGCYGDMEPGLIRPYLMHPILDAAGRLYIGTGSGGVVVIADEQVRAQQSPP